LAAAAGILLPGQVIWQKDHGAAERRAGLRIGLA
jgi:hypothetical protein